MNKKIKSILIIGIASLLTVVFTTLGVLYVLERKKAMNEVASNISWYDENETEFVITTKEELYGLAKLSDKYDFKGQTIKLGADIVVNEGTASDWDTKTPSNRWSPITGFAGTFDGQGHSISGLFAKGSNANLGLFAETLSNCEIKNLKILNSYFCVNGSFPIGSLTANGSGKFSQIYSDAIMVSDGEFCGGLIGALNAGGGSAALGQSSRISNCWFDGEVRLTKKDSRQGGGIVGCMQGGTADILHCLNTGSITNQNEKIKGSRIGGIIGGVEYVNSSGTLRMEDCLNAGTVKSASDSYVGSVIGCVGSASVKVSLKDVYTTAESAARTIGFSQTSVTGSVRMLSSEHIKGKDWYSWSTLNFDSQWAVTEETPMLQCFAEDVPSVDGLKKAYDISWYSDAESSFELTTKEQLIGLSILSTDNTFEGKTIRLGADIVMNEGTSEDWLKKTPAYIWTPIGNGVTAETGFCGNFDGQGHTISGLFLKNAELGVGLFRCIGTTTSVRNLRIENCYFEYNGNYETSAYLGSIAGRSYGNLDTIYSNATLVSSGQSNGGMLGLILTSGLCTINNCWYDGDLRMVGNVKNGGRMGGGIVGRIESGQTTISHCLMSGNVSSEAILNGIHIGGFVGYIRYTRKNEGVKLNITDSLMSGTVHARYISCVGIIVGRVFEEVTATLTNTYAVQGNAVVEDGDTITYVSTVSRIDDTGVVKGGCLRKPKEQLTGYNGYIWTLLDFDKYWSVVPGGNGQKAGTPVLKSFADSTPSLAGKTRMIDTKWYDASKKTYTISNIRQLYGLSELAGGMTNFEGKTVKLGADITVNTGNAAEWKNQAPSYLWLPIGAEANATQGFCGIFDGQGHTISGLYCKTNETGLGLFRAAGPDSVVKNLRLTNSYFEYVSEKRSTAAAGVVGRGYGDIDTVYSDAIIRSGGIANGGMVGQMYGDKDTKINNCWYAGLIEMVGTDNDDGGQHAGGMAGRIECGAVSVTHCLFSGKMTCEADKAAAHIGGIVGYIRWQKKDDGSKLNITDCLVSGTSQIVYNSCAGAVLGRVCADMTATINKTYAVENSLVITREGKTSYGTLVGYKEGELVGGAIEKTKEQLTGTNGYMFTELNFDKYWAITPDGTPVLQSFASSVPSVAGLKKMVDTSWYKADQKSYTLKTVAQLYGFADVVRGLDNFKDKTVKLGADIKVNAGTVTEWEKNGFQGLIKWVPIGTASYAFRGNFDGQGHTISGLYMNGDGAQALFARAYGDNITLKNFSIKNTYIKSTGGSNGSVAAVFHGNMEHIYSDADIVVEGTKDNVRYNTGGFAGWLNGFDTTFSHCWFAGSITCNGQAVGGIYGVQYYTHVVTIDHCLVTATLETTTSQASQILGGFAGSVHGNYAGKDLVPKLVLKNSVFEGTLNTHAPNANMTGSTVGQVSTSNPEGGLWIENSWFTQSNGKYVIGWQAGDATVTCDGGKTKYTGSCSALNSVLGKDVAEITTLNKKLGLKDKIWCDTIEGIALKEFVGNRELIDISWYDKKNDTYTIKTKAQLYGFSRINEANENAFKGKTVQLGDTITVNSGTVDEWKDNSFEGLIRWQPIGVANAFNGNFDGNGHTISGLYMKGSGYQALFAKAYGDKDDSINIGNFDLKNTHIESSGSYNGSIAGKFSGNLTSVYSDAEIVVDVNSNHNNWYHTGGMIGAVADGDTAIANCWYAGNLTANGSSTGGILGYYGTDVELAIGSCLVDGILTTNVPSGNASMGGFVGKVYSENAKTIKINNSLCTADVIKGEGATPTHVGQLIGQIYAVNCDFTVNQTYYPETTTAIGSVDGNTIKMNGNHWKSDTVGTANAKANNHLNNVRKYASWTDASTVASMDLDTFIWKDNGAGSQVLLLNGHEEGLYRVNLMWYAENKNTYTIDTQKELYELSCISNYMGKTFSGKTVILGDDITINTGNVPQRVQEGDDTLIKWTPIGTYTDFCGNFSGGEDIHTISGLYMNGVGKQGLFYHVKNGSIKNLKLLNSYMHSTGSYNGSIVAIFSGTMENVYSNAYMDVAFEGNSEEVGGLIGRVNLGTGDGILKNCQYDGTLNTSDHQAGGLVGQFGAGSAAHKMLMENCLVTGILNVTDDKATNHARFGGLVGSIWSTNNTDLTMKNCLFNGKQTGAGSMAQKHGNFVGQIAIGTGTLTLENCYAYKGEAACGDFLGEGQSGKVVVGNSSYTSSTGNNGLNSSCTKTSKLTNSVLNFDESVWCDTNTGIALVVFTGENERIDIGWYDEDKNSFTLTNAGQLYGLAYLSNHKSVNFAGKTIQLGADITFNTGNVPERAKNNDETLLVWTPIGLDTAFNGTLDGNGHTISGLYISDAKTDYNKADYSGRRGLFYQARNCTIKNLKLVNSYMESSGSYNGSVAGYFSGTMENVYSDVYIKHTTGENVGGLVGYVRLADKASVINNCQYAGYMDTTDNVVGGIVGMCSGANIMTITNCLVTGTMNVSDGTGTRYGGFVGSFNATASTASIMKNCIFNGKQTGITTDVNTTTVGYGLLIGQVALGTSGKLDLENCYAVKKTETTGTDFLGNMHTGTVYDVLDKNTAYSSYDAANDMNSKYIKQVHTVYNNELKLDDTIWCDTNAGIALVALTSENERIDISWYDENKNTFKLTNGGQLYGLAYLSNHKSVNFSGKTIQLEKDIVLNTGNVPERAKSNDETLIAWAPIGLDTAFNGTLDGNGHTISGLYVNDAKTDYNKTDYSGRRGLFYQARNCTIKNLKLLNSYMESSGNYNGSIAGYFSGTMENVYSDAYIKHTTGENVGGLVGYVRLADKASAINNCQYAGHMDTTDNVVGGIVGMCSGANVMTMTNCLVTGTMNIAQGAGTRFGGLVGSFNATHDTTASLMKNCVFNGVQTGFTGSNNDDTTVGHGLFIGQIALGSNGNLNLENCYAFKSTETVCTDFLGNKHTGTVKYGTGDGAVSYSLWGTANNFNKAPYMQTSVDSFTVTNCKLDKNVWNDSTNGPILTIFKEFAQ